MNDAADSLMPDARVVNHGQTVRRSANPVMKMGAVAADMLIERMAAGWRPVEKRESPAPLILRRSAGTPPDAPPDAADLSFKLLRDAL